MGEWNVGRYTRSTVLRFRLAGMALMLWYGLAAHAGPIARVDLRVETIASQQKSCELNLPNCVETAPYAPGQSVDFMFTFDAGTVDSVPDANAGDYVDGVLNFAFDNGPVVVALPFGSYKSNSVRIRDQDPAAPGTPRDATDARGSNSIDDPATGVTWRHDSFSAWLYSLAPGLFASDHLSELFGVSLEGVDLAGGTSFEYRHHFTSEYDPATGSATFDSLSLIGAIQSFRVTRVQDVPTPDAVFLTLLALITLRVFTRPSHSALRVWLIPLEGP